MRILLGTNHFQEIAGSELVVQEFAELFLNMGHEVVITANFVGQPMRGMAERAGATTCLATDEINALEFDLVMVINQIAPLLGYKATMAIRPATRFVFMHVDLNFKLSQPGLIHEPLLADEIWLHSEEAKDYFIGEGLPEQKVSLFHNAAPPRFWRPEREYRELLERVVIISNHLPDELTGMAMILRQQGVTVVHYGRNGEAYRRISPKVLLDADVVITIGKTVQYCIASRTPVFIYDHFAGPGYLNADNFETAAWFNFSGRCFQKARSAEQLATDVVDGYQAGKAFMREMPDSQRGRYRLRPQLIKLAERIEATTSNAQRLKMINENAQPMRHEAALAKGAGMFYRMWRGAHLTVEKLKKENNTV